MLLIEYKYDLLYDVEYNININVIIIVKDKLNCTSLSIKIFKEVTDKSSKLNI